MEHDDPLQGQGPASDRCMEGDAGCEGVPVGFLSSAPTTGPEDGLHESGDVAEASKGVQPAGMEGCSGDRSGASGDGSGDEPCQSSADQQQAPPGALLRSVLSLAGEKRNCLIALDGDHLLLGAGPACVLLHVPSGQQRALPCRAGATVGALALHPSGHCFAVGEERRHGTPSM